MSSFALTVRNEAVAMSLPLAVPVDCNPTVLSRLVRMRIRKECSDLTERLWRPINFLTKMRSDKAFVYHVRYARDQAMLHWFSQGQELYFVDWIKQKESELKSNSYSRSLEEQEAEFFARPLLMLPKETKQKAVKRIAAYRR